MAKQKKTAVKRGRMPVADRQAMTVRLRPGSLRAVRQMALDTDCSVQDVVDEAIAKYLAKEPKLAKVAAKGDGFGVLTLVERRVLSQALDLFRSAQTGPQSILLSILKNWRAWKSEERPPGRKIHAVK